MFSISIYFTFIEWDNIDDRLCILYSILNSSNRYKRCLIFIVDLIRLGMINYTHKPEVEARQEFREDDYSDKGGSTCQQSDAESKASDIGQGSYHLPGIDGNAIAAPAIAPTLATPVIAGKIDYRSYKGGKFSNRGLIIHQIHSVLNRSINAPLFYHHPPLSYNNGQQ